MHVVKIIIINGIMLNDMDPVWLAKQVLQLFMAAVVSIVSRHGLRNEVHFNSCTFAGKNMEHFN